MEEITLIYPHQLFAHHPGLAPGRVVVLVEEPLLLGTDPSWPLQFHPQKLALHRHSLEAYRRRLEAAGYPVRLQRHDQAASTEDHLALLLAQGVRHLHLVDPVDDWLERRIRRWSAREGLRLSWYATPMLLTPVEEGAAFLARGKKPSMARFYERQRRRLDVLIDPQGQPVGGRWSFDADNRKKLPKQIQLPPNPLHPLDADPQAETETCLVPNDHSGAERWLDAFLEQRLQQFGAYEDAISREHHVLWHSVLTPMLNIGLLTPQQVLDRTLTRAEAGDVPLNSLEGFVRQIIGWREFMALMYRHHGVTLRNGNFWGLEDRPIPEAFYTGHTGLPPIDAVIQRVRRSGYCHHIERLMLLGNVMLLCGFHPTRICNWFMELFLDAYDWVMVPNVYGMSQFADGGLFTTKPYVSGSNYVRKMSDYPKGPWCDVWDSLFWSFIDRHGDFFRSQVRLAMMTRHLDRMGEGTRAEHRQRAQRFLDELA